MAYTLAISQISLAWDKAVKRDALICQKCLKVPSAKAFNHFCDYYAYGVKIVLGCQCQTKSKGVADGMDGKIGQNIADAFHGLLSEWNSENATTIKTPTNTEGLIQ